LHDEELQNLYVGGQIKEDEIGTHGLQEKEVHVEPWWENL
jgi:hypothetical protein